MGSELPEGVELDETPQIRPTTQQPAMQQQPTIIGPELPEGITLDEPQPVQPTEPEPVSDDNGTFFGQLYQGNLSPKKQKAFNELISRGIPLASIFSKVNSIVRESPEIASAYARPIVSGAAGAAGAFFGSTAGPVGTAAGGGLGYAIGEELADKFDEFLGLRERKPLMVELTESGVDIVEGATMEMGGQLLAAGAGKAFSLGKKGIEALAKKSKPITQEGATKAAAEVLAAETSGGPLIAENIADAAALEKEIPGLRFSRGQTTNDPSIIKFERARARMPGEAAQEQLEAAARNTEAIQEYIKKKKGVGGIEEVTTPLTAQKEATETGVKKAAGILETEAAQLEGAAAEEIGETIKTAAAKGKKAAKGKAGELFEEVPEVDIDGSSLITKIDELSKPLSKFEDVAENIPKEFKFFKKVLSESNGVVNPNDLQGLRSSLTGTLRDLRGSASPNNRKIARLTGLLKEVDTILDTAPPVKEVAEKITEKAVEAGKQLKTARSFYNKEVVEKYGKGAIGEILKKGDKVSNANVAGRFFKPGFKGTESANEFIAAVGENKNARGALEDYIKQDLLSSSTNPVTGEIVETKLKTWLSKYKPALKKLGLENKFDSISKASSELTKAREMKVAFDKSVASKLLKSDVDTAVKNAFASGSKKKAAVDLMEGLKGNNKAVSGLQNSTIDHIIKNAETTASDAFGNPVISLAKVENEYKKFKPALDVLFKKSPEKLKALDQYRRALKIMQRGKVSPLGGGSDTAENIITSMAAASGIAKGKVATIAKSILSPLIQMSDNQVNSILNRAAFDPDFAYTVQMMAKGKPIDKVEQRLKGHLAAMLMRGTIKEEKK